MTSIEYAQFILKIKKETIQWKMIDETTAYEVSQLFSGTFTYLLYEALWISDFDMDTITRHLEILYDSNNHFGMIYFIFILANAAEFTIPVQFSEMSANEAIIPFLTAAIIEDWLEYDASKEITEYEG